MNATKKQTFLVRQLADPEYRVSLSADKAGLLRGSLLILNCY